MDTKPAEVTKKPLSPTHEYNASQSAAAVQAKFAQQLAIAAEQVYLIYW